jgi:hypothetical protein
MTLEMLKIEFASPGYRPLKQNVFNKTIYFVGKGFINMYKTIDGTQQLFMDTIE